MEKLFQQLNAGRCEKLAEELKVLRNLPTHKLPDCKPLRVRVSSESTIMVHNNTYSVDSILIGEEVKVQVYAEHLSIWYAQKCVEHIPPLGGEGKHKTQYWHIIDWFVRKPGAFEKSMVAFDRRRLPAKVDALVGVLLEGSFLDREENVLAFGNPGSGKSHSLCAISQEMIYLGRRVLFRPYEIWCRNYCV